MKRIYKSDVRVIGESFVICSSDKGICSFGREVPAFQDVDWQPGALQNRRYIEDIACYERGELTTFDWIFDIAGTAFQQTVWQALLSIPYGESRSYADIAAAVGKPSAVRAVGGAIGRNPVLIAIPCHRVLGKNGKLTGFSSGLQLKERLLAIEGVQWR